ncbi:MAG: AraC family transcriptional regulator [Actinomycetota bacterium]
MSKAKIESAGLRESASSLIPDLNSELSSGKIWNGLIIKQHKFARTNAPDYKTPDQSLIIQFSPLPAEKDKRNFNSINRPAKICFFSTGSSPRRPCTHQKHEVLVLMLSPEILRRAVHELRSNLNIVLAEHHKVTDAQVEHIGMALKTEAEDGYLSGRLYGESLGTALSVHLLSKYSVIKSNLGETGKGGMTPANLRRVVEYIHDNLTEDIGLSNLAKVANLSQFRFAHNFKQATGLAPHQYVIRERLERAKTMLRETNLTVTAIAYAVGCGSPSRFTLLFRRANGVNPSIYRSSFR